jgi:hypothetical protein
MDGAGARGGRRRLVVRMSIVRRRRRIGATMWRSNVCTEPTRKYLHSVQQTRKANMDERVEGEGWDVHAMCRKRVLNKFDWIKAMRGIWSNKDANGEIYRTCVVQFGFLLLFIFSREDKFGEAKYTTRRQCASSYAAVVK